MPSSDELAKLWEALQDHEQRLSTLESARREMGGAGSPKPKALTEFLLEVKPANLRQVTLAIGYYLERHLGCGSFNISNLRKGFRTAKHKPAKNVNDMVNKNIKRGHMTEAPGKKDQTTAWVLTNSGERYVESAFQEGE